MRVGVRICTLGVRIRVTVKGYGQDCGLGLGPKREKEWVVREREGVKDKERAFIR